MNQKERQSRINNFCNNYNRRQEERARRGVDVIIKEEINKLGFFKRFFYKLLIEHENGYDRYSNGEHRIYINKKHVCTYEVVNY